MARTAKKCPKLHSGPLKSTASECQVFCPKPEAFIRFYTVIQYVHLCKHIAYRPFIYVNTLRNAKFLFNFPIFIFRLPVCWWMFLCVDVCSGSSCGWMSAAEVRVGGCLQPDSLVVPLVPDSHGGQHVVHSFSNKRMNDRFIPQNYYSAVKRRQKKLAYLLTSSIPVLFYFFLFLQCESIQILFGQDTSRFNNTWTPFIF